MNTRRTLFGIFDLVLLLAIASALVSTQLEDANELAVEAAEASRQVHRLSDLLRQSTDDLTRMARLYAVTGEAQYRSYYEEILAIRNGESPRPEAYEEDDNYWDHVLAQGGQRPGEFGPPLALRDLLRDPAFTDSELAVLPGAEMQLLEESERLSHDLALLEQEVMAAVAEQVEADPDSFVPVGAAQAGLQFLHSPAYHAAKIEILAPLAELEEASEERIAAEVEIRRQRHRQLRNIQLALAVATALLMLVALVLERRNR